jgi:hypothetical protein
MECDRTGIFVWAADDKEAVKTFGDRPALPCEQKANEAK